MINLLNSFIFENINKATLGTGKPVLSGIESVSVWTTVILIVISLMLPCFIWFIRNFIRIVLKKNYELFNRSIKWILLFCLILFIVSIILLILATQGII